MAELVGLDDPGARQVPLCLPATPSSHRRTEALFMDMNPEAFSHSVMTSSSQHLSEQSLTRNQNGAAEFTHRELVTASGPRGDPQTIVLMKGPGATTGDLDTRLGRTRVHVYLASALSHAGR